MQHWGRFQLLTIIKLASLLQEVRQKLDQKEQKKVAYSGKITIRGVRPGVSVTVPDDPIVNGKYNVFVQIRGGTGATNAGINTIIVTCEAGGMASKENKERFGNAAWLREQLAEIQSVMTKHFGNVSLGKLGLGSFSGGYDAVASILSSEFKDKVDNVIVLDGIHGGNNPAKMKAWNDYAAKVKDDPSKKFVFVYTAVKPTGYSSTTDSANYLNSTVGAQKVQKDKAYAGVKPSNVYNAGGYTAIQLFDNSSSLQDMKNQHITAAKTQKDVMEEYLSDWNK